MVTYNRRELLAECLRALAAQTHPLERIFVVDNASTDGTEEHLIVEGLLEDARVEYVRLDENRGGAGGFARAVELTRTLEGDWIWLMHDDSEPVPDALERLLAAAPAAMPRRWDCARRSSTPTAGSTPTSAGSSAAGCGGCLRRSIGMAITSSSASCPSSARSGAARPRTRLLCRAPTSSSGATTSSTRSVCAAWGAASRQRERHRAQARHALLRERPSRFWNRVLPGQFWPTPLERFWQNLCGLRNYLWTKQEYEGQGALSAAGATVQFIIKALLYDEQPLRRIPWIVRFARQGRSGRFQTIPPARWVEMVRDGRV